MNIRPFTRLLTRGGLFATLVFPAWSFAQTEYDELIIFGDSLTDSGNYFVVTGEVQLQPYVAIPSSPYALGGHHFSNGKVWAELLAKELSRPTSGKPSMRSPGVFTNYAFGRSRARPGAPVFSDFDIGTQVALYLGDTGGTASEDALYVIWIGSNDVRDALFALFTDPSGATSQAIIAAAIGATANNVVALTASGARNFLILNVPNLAIVPAVAEQGPVAQFFGQQLSQGYNNALAATLNGLGPALGIDIVQLDVFSLLNAISAFPDLAGLANTTDPCLTFDVLGDVICTHPDDYLFWDGVHPTKAGHSILADAAADAITAP